MLFNLAQMAQIVNALEMHIKDNQSGGEVVFTIGESVLMLMRACETAKVDNNILSKLKILYLEGVKCEDDQDFITAITGLFVDKKQFKVSADPHVVNADSSRRYFETHLAYHLLQPTVAALDLGKLKSFTLALKAHSEQFLFGSQKEAIMKVLGGIIDPSLTKYQLEYAELIFQLNSHTFHGLSSEACEKLSEIAKSTYLSTENTVLDKKMPANIYSGSIFDMGMSGRGRIVKLENYSVLSGGLGLIQSITPIPRGDIAGYSEHDDEVPLRGAKTGSTVNVARQQVSPFCRSADQATFMLESSWSQRLFNRQMQIYSNGISSTTLATLRNLLMQKRKGKPFHAESLQDYMIAFAALMVYNSGGHSFFEIFEVLKLPQFKEIMEAFGCSELIERDELMQEWLFKYKPDLFDKALQESIDYMQLSVNRRILHAQLQSKSISAYDHLHDHPIDIITNVAYSSAGTKKFSLDHAVLTQNIVEFKRNLEAISKEGMNLDLIIQQKNASRYTAMMIAAQIGKLEHLKILAAHIEDIPERTTGLSEALICAINGEQYEVVHYILDQKLEFIGCSLYAAACQTNTAILDEVINKCAGVPRVIKDIAIRFAIQFENVEFTMKLINFLSPDEINSILEEQKRNTLREAVMLGNLALVSALLESRIAPEFPLKTLIDSFNYIDVTKLLMHHGLKNGHLPEQRVLDIFLDRALIGNNFDIAILFIAYGGNLANCNEKNRGEFEKYLKTLSVSVLLSLIELKIAAQRLVSQIGFDPKRELALKKQVEQGTGTRVSEVSMADSQVGLGATHQQQDKEDSESITQNQNSFFSHDVNTKTGQPSAPSDASVKEPKLHK